MSADTFSDDDDDEWLGFNDIFSPAPLVPPGAEAYEVALPTGRTVRAVQSVAAFTRRGDPATGAAELGADCARNTSALIWDASVVLATFFSRHHAALLPDGASCVELGAGAGLAGLTAAALGYSTILTDRAEALEPLRRAIERNELQTRASVAELPWGCESAARSVLALLPARSSVAEGDGPADGNGPWASLPAVGCLLLADLLYEMHLLEPLLQTVAHLSNEATVILMAYDHAIHRHAVYAAFFAACTERGYVWHDLDAAAPPSSVTATLPGDEAAVPATLKESVRLVRLERRS